MKDETKLQRTKRHMKVAAISSVSGVALKTGHVHATAREQRQKDEVSPEGLASEA